MFRLFVGCVMVAAACVTAVVLLAPAFGQREGDDPVPPGPAVIKGAADTPSRPEPMARADADDGKAAVSKEVGKGGASQPLTILDGRVLPIMRQDVPCEREGKLLILATEAQPGEYVPKHKLLIYPVNALAMPVANFDRVPEGERIIEDSTGRTFRAARAADFESQPPPMLVRHKVRLRTLDVGDKVKEGQLLGVVNPVLAVEDLAIKLALVEAAEADVKVSGAMKEESGRRLIGIETARFKSPNSVSLDDYMIAKVTVARYGYEELAKRSGVKKAQRELSASQTTLSMYQVRASISGVIRALYKQPGEAVRNLEPILQLQNPDVLRVEAQIEVTDALVLRKRLQRAERWRGEAQGIRLDALLKGDTREPAAAARLMRAADEQTRIEVEASRQEPPLASLNGHTQEVTCVGVTAEADPRVVSGSEDHTVRLWRRVAGEDRWVEESQIDHHAVVRSLAVTGPKGERPLLLTGTASGRGRLFDLSDLKKGEVMLDGRHTGAINAAAFSGDGGMCVTGGEDNALCLWETKGGKLLGRVPNAHRSAVTSAAFTAKGQVVTAGRDKQILVWKLAEGGPGGRTLKLDLPPVDRRGGDVPVLGTDPEGENTLFDDGLTLRVQSLSGRNLVGTLRNPPGTPNFAHFALFSPDGKTILAGGNGPGRLQLWRAPSAGARPAELRQYLWSGAVTTAAFAPGGKFAVTGTADHRVLVWQLPDKVEIEKPLVGHLTFVEEFLDTSLRKLTMRATVENPDGWVLPGATATVVVPPVR